jgi:hypothetical protein
VIDLDSREVLFTVEHETRSQTHPMYGRPLVNRNPAATNMRLQARARQHVLGDVVKVRQATFFSLPPCGGGE